ncbi:hypothetical protein CIB95_06775 [Lottiidibacillus patelloidae]|uniref:GerMN domain-containing protein n=1 Tax=Lottiidibacillus patelloidae TaxID=2670334 RepID=A0A263BV08_9BACI|nr:hypothetical protein [Lottiidibacillus patelloidae]OZM57167.1 hypothetical protein CIB95_06775 [Lottiidibacillus patelloidae]
MNKKDWSEEELIQQLKKMPEMKDTRSKEEIFRNIEHRLPTKKSTNHKKWYVTLATSAAAIIFLLLLPSFQGENILDAPLPTEDTSNFHSQNTLPSINGNDNNNMGINSHTSIVDKIDNSVVISSINGGIYPGALINFGHSLDLVTIAVPDQQAEIMIPLAYLYNRDSLMNDANLYNAFNNNGFKIPNGLSNFLLKDARFTLVTTDSKTVHIDVNANHQFASGSTSVMMFYATVEALLKYSEFDRATFSTDGKAGIELDNVGKIYELKQSENKSGYYLYEVASTKQHFLVPIAFEGLSFEEMLNQMSIQELEKNYKAILPAGFVKDVEEIGNSVVITFDEKFNLNEMAYNIEIIDAILFTAKEFGYEFVKFNGIGDVIGLGPYNFTEKIKVPIRPNAIHVPNE